MGVGLYTSLRTCAQGCKASRILCLLLIASLLATHTGCISLRSAYYHAIGEPENRRKSKINGGFGDLIIGATVGGFPGAMGHSNEGFVIGAIIMTLLVTGLDLLVWRYTRRD